MVNREYIKSKIDTLPEEIVLKIDKLIKCDICAQSISNYNKKTQKAIREAHEKPHKSKSFKNTEELYKDLGI